ncbi:MAG: hypothetical protein ABFS45_23580 [Pseudomonadota bacterium]
MIELLSSSLALVAASFGIVAVAAGFIWCWIKFSLFYQKNYQNF